MGNNGSSRYIFAAVLSCGCFDCDSLRPVGSVIWRLTRNFVVMRGGR